MEKIIRVLNELVRAGVVDRYAIGGAVGVIFYTEAVSTKDVDVFVSAPQTPSGVIHLGSIYDYLKRAGYPMEGQYFIIDGVPVDFLAVYDDLTMEALERSTLKRVGKTMARVFRPEYLAAVALKTGRPQDMKKIDLLVAAPGLDEDSLKDLLKRHGLLDKWRRYVNG
ncbi:MAG: nucleotidyltransferase [Deltaproteobacteria bacterium]|nr:nucleotidyltransferase [Deltaproteobacteria bacterium]